MALHDVKLDPFCSKFYGPSLKENGRTDAALHALAHLERRARQEESAS